MRSPGASRDALRVARVVATELIAGGALAVTLHGSHARGDAGLHSDIDLVAIGRGPAYELSRRARYLVSVSWYTRSALMRAFRDPSRICGAIPGWREAVILVDHEGVAATLKRHAERWTWDRIEGACDRWVADQFTGWTEEIHKLVEALGRNDDVLAAVLRATLAIRLAAILAVHRRILYGSENRLWDVVAEAMGEPWASAQRAALALDGASSEESARAALRLYVIAAAEVRPVLSAQQRRVVDHAVAIAREAWEKR